MSRIGRSAVCVVVGWGAVLSAIAQGDEGNVPPTIVGTTWTIFRNLDGIIDGLFGPAAAFTPGVDNAREFDILWADIDIFDPDFVDDEGNPSDEEVFLAVNAHFTPLPGYPTPVGPPVRQSTDEFVGGFGSAGGTTITVRWRMQAPAFIGKNQARLRGLIDWDVRYRIVFAVSNEEDPDSWTPGAQGNPAFCGGFVFTENSVTHVFCDWLHVVENPALAPPNPQAFADAGADIIVAAGTTVRLDGRRTFDAFNVGFDDLSDDVFEKDNITFTWEWISGPERVEPIYPDLRNQPAIAEVTLNDLGTYVYRLTVDDNVNDLPTQDLVTIEVVSSIPENRAPIARARGPAEPIIVGGVITLDGTASFDPDGDPLSYIWQQTDEIGGQIPSSDIGRFFQPLSGVESPISRWQAIKPGTFHFRLLVNDGEFVAADRISVTVVEAETAGFVVNAGFVGDRNAPDDDQSAEVTPNQIAPACGMGMLPVAMVPLAMLLIRPRRRS